MASLSERRLNKLRCHFALHCWDIHYVPCTKLCACIVLQNPHSYLGDDSHNDVTALETEAKRRGHTRQLLGVSVKVLTRDISSSWLMAFAIGQGDVMGRKLEHSTCAQGQG